MHLFQQLRYKWKVIVILLVYICVQTYCIQQLTSTYDEGLFGLYGVTILKLQGNKDIVKFDSKLPITALNMLPRAIIQVFHPGLRRSNAYTDIIMGRFVSLLVTVILALIIYHWSALLYGSKAGLFSLIIFLLCPNFLAHGIFVSSDIYACLFMTASFYFLWKFRQSNQTRHFIFASFSVALAQISKFSMLHLVILFSILLVIGILSGDGIVFRKKFTGGKWAGLLFIFCCINWLVICTAHLFYGMFIPLNDYHFRSETFQHLQSLLHGAGAWLRLPFPSSYIESLDMVIYLDKLGGGRPGSTIGPIYMLGKSSANGFWYYYFVAFLYKLPLSILFLVLLTMIAFFKKKPLNRFLQDEMFLIIPAIYFLIYLDFFYSTQIGIRHIIIILPLIYIFIGFFYQQMVSSTGRYCCYALLVYQCLSVGRYFPHFLPYTNELIPDKRLAYKKIADTNICYGEGGKYLLQYLHTHPEAKYLPPVIVPGTIVMEVNEMLNLDVATMGKYDWVKGLVPADHIHSEYLIFNVSPASADSLRKIY